VFKNKKSLYILLPLNLLVWGFIAYKIISSLGADELPEMEQVAVSGGRVDVGDTTGYVLSLNYEDPFLKQEPERRSNHQQERAKPTQVTAPPKQPVKAAAPETDIKYLGIVQNKTSGLTMAMISINGNSHVIKKGEVAEGIKVQDISQEFIEVREGKKTLKIAR